MLDEIYLQIRNYRRVTGVSPDRLTIHPTTLRSIITEPGASCTDKHRCFGLLIIQSNDIQEGKFIITATLKAFNR